MILYYAKVSPGEAGTKAEKTLRRHAFASAPLRAVTRYSANIGPGSNRHARRGGTHFHTPEYPLWFASLMDSREATSPLLPVPQSPRAVEAGALAFLNWTRVQLDLPATCGEAFVYRSSPTADAPKACLHSGKLSRRTPKPKATMPASQASRFLAKS
jgi:hypothetical protein